MTELGVIHKGHPHEGEGLANADACKRPNFADVLYGWPLMPFKGDIVAVGHIFKIKDIDV